MWLGSSLIGVVFVNACLTTCMTWNETVYSNFSKNTIKYLSIVFKIESKNYVSKLHKKTHDDSMGLINTIKYNF